jgi:hypothetical protein
MHAQFSGKARGLPQEDIKDRRDRGLVNKYYDAVIARLRDAEHILILGQGEAKVEVEKRLERGLANSDPGC